MSGAIKSIGKAVKKVVKGVAHFVKKYWKVIVIAAAIVFTAGIATVGVAGFSSAMAAAGGGFGGFMSAVGSTMVAGVASIGGTIGIGSGVTASTAGGAFASAPVMAGVSSGAGLTLGTGAAAQGLGLAASTYAPAAGAAGTGAAGAGVAGAAGDVAIGTGSVAAPTATSAELAAFPTSTATGAAIDAGTSAAGASSVQAAAAPAAPAAQAGTTDVALGTNAVAGTTASGAAGSSPGLLGTILNSKAAGPLIYGGMQMLSGYAQGKAQQDALDQTKPLSFWGVGARGDSNGGGAVQSIFGPGETLTGQATPFTQPNGANTQQPLQQISPYVPDARANLPNGVSWMPNLPNAKQGLMTLGWDTTTGKPIYANDPRLAFQGG